MVRVIGKANQGAFAVEHCLFIVNMYIQIFPLLMKDKYLNIQTWTRDLVFVKLKLLFWFFEKTFLKSS